MAVPITSFKGYPPGSEPDVKINTPCRVFLLHSQVLQLCSRWFAASMSDVWWKAEKNTDGYRYCYDFDYDKDGFSTLIPTQKGAVDENRTESEKEAPDIDPVCPNPILEPIKNLCSTYENMFRFFYRLPASGISTVSWMDLVSLADQFEALDSIRDGIRSYVLEIDDLGEQVKKSPVKFIILGYNLQSYQIFKEALIHIVGRQCGKHDPKGFWWDSADLDIPAPAVKAMVSECFRVEHLLSNVMRTLLCLDITQFPRIGPQYFTGYVNQITKCFKTHGAHGNEGVLFQEIGKLQLDSGEIAAFVKAIALPFIKSNLRFRIEVPYLTCAHISESQLPWKE